MQARTVCEFVIEGEAVPQSRPRYWNGRMVSSPAGSRLRAWRGSVYVQSRPHRPPEPLLGPVELELVLYLKPPKSAIGRRGGKPYLKRRIPITTRADEDNMRKAIQDELKRAGYFVDDRRVSDGITRKRYHELDEEPHVEVIVRQWEETSSDG